MKNIFKNRFKFKIWDKTKKKFLPLDSKTENTDSWISIDNTGVYLVERDNALDVAFFTDITEDVIILQCTGLRDKNGKLIYEGDIVADVVSGCVAIIEYLHSSYSLMAHIRRMDEFVSIEDICFVDKEGTPFEVVGNIYESPKLLEDKQWRN